MAGTRATPGNEGVPTAEITHWPDGRRCPPALNEVARLELRISKGAPAMQLDPSLQVQVREQELSRLVKHNASQRDWREAMARRAAASSNRTGGGRRPDRLVQALTRAMG